VPIFCDLPFALCLLLFPARRYNADSIATTQIKKACMSLNLSGIVAAVPTPFDQSGEIAHEKLVENIQHWNKTDLIGYLILGSTGEFPHLDKEEKLALIDTVKANLPYDKLLLVGTGELSTRHTLEMTKIAADRGADGAVVVTPFYYKKLLRDEELIAHYRRIADNSPIPVLIYLIPQFSGVYLMPETIAELADHPNIIGLKESSGDLESLRHLFNELGEREFNVMLGAPPLLTEGLALGATGAIFAVAALAPQACYEVIRSYKWGDQERAERIKERLTALAKAVAVPGVGWLKAAMDMCGLYGFLPRSPLPVPDDAARAEIEQALLESGFFARVDEQQPFQERDDLREVEF
jgi:4-hydroxy-2-oxoglutarate aldolase